jgi:4-diphosphocytidyl-2-C-methyl-D-erythritol kinase
MSITVFAPAKINLSLRVSAPLPNGRHLLDSLVAFTNHIGDTLTIERKKTLELTIEGPFGDDFACIDDNLVLHAARALQKASQTDFGAAIRLKKCLPLASGIGGGSSDAAAALRGLNTLWGLDLKARELAQIGASLGADVPACLLAKPLRMTGTGEEIVEIGDGPRLGIVLVNPLRECPTGAVYQQFDRLGSFSEMNNQAWPDLASTQGLLDFLAITPNDLTQAANCQVSEISSILSDISESPGVLFNAMSGSGATCFGLYPTLDAAVMAAKHLKRTFDQNQFWVEADVIN